MLEHAQVGLHPGMDGTLPASAVDFHIPPPFPRSVYSESAVITSLSWPSLTETAPAISRLVQRSTSLAVRGLRMLERRGHEATGRRAAQSGGRRSVAGAARSQHLNGRGSAGGLGRGGPFFFCALFVVGGQA